MRRKIALAVLSFLLALGAAVYLRPTPLPPSPRTLKEKIRLIEGITYEEEAPYLDARSVFRNDGLAWRCEPNNYEKLKGTTTHHGYNIWIAEVATEVGPRFFTVPVNKYAKEMWSKDKVGDSPWGVYMTPEIRTKMEPIFEDAKAEIIERLEEKERQHEQARTSTSSADPG